jgi:hypothetical protein
VGFAGTVLDLMIRENHSIGHEELSEWIDRWYGSRLDATIFVRRGGKRIMPYELMTIYPEDVPYVKRLREQEEKING